MNPLPLNSLIRRWFVFNQTVKHMLHAQLTLLKLHKQHIHKQFPSNSSNRNIVKNKCCALSAHGHAEGQLCMVEFLQSSLTAQINS